MAVRGGMFVHFENSMPLHGLNWPIHTFIKLFGNRRGESSIIRAQTDRYVTRYEKSRFFAKIDFVPELLDGLHTWRSAAVL